MDLARMSSPADTTLNHLGGWIERGPVLVLTSAVMFNLALCFVNTRIVTLSASAAILAEILIIGTAALLIAARSVRTFYYTVLLLFVLSGYFAMLFVGRMAFDPKPIRDLAVPIVFFMLGCSYTKIEQADAVFRTVTIIALCVGFYEYFFIESFTSIFNIGKYFVDKGALDASVAGILVDGLGISGIRPLSQGRELLPWLLSGHRVSSIFLEPVTTANFGAIATAWFLYKRGSLRKSAGWVFACITLIVLSDGRFGLLLAVLAIFLFIIRRYLRAELMMFLPLIVALFLFFKYALFGTNVFPNTFGGRLDYAGHLFLKLEAVDWFGLTVYRPLYDAGYAYAVTQFGILATVMLWFVFALTVIRKKAAASYLVCYYMLFISLALMTSGSLYSIKASSLMWFAIGNSISFGFARFHQQQYWLARQG